ncbi:MAG: hypothetical protein FWE56_03505 [Candidatus Bathyarchaeota archaeon]|nr:hypothetical protein [Candidatus Termiticorpusculum sp.]
MSFRTPSTLTNTASETVSPVANQLGAGTVQTIGITPLASQGRAIQAIKLRIDATITQGAATAWNIGQLINEISIVKGSATRLKLTGYNQLVRFYNALTGLSDQGYRFFNNVNNVGMAGTSNLTFECLIPIELATNVIPVLTLAFNGFSAVGATQGTVTTTVTYYYTSSVPADDSVIILNSPTDLNANTDTDISQYFTYGGVINRVWLDVSSDVNINSQSYITGNNPVYDRYTSFDLRAISSPAIFHQPIDGFLLMRTNPVSYPLNGVSGAKPILNINLATKIPIMMMLFTKIAN